MMAGEDDPWAGVLAPPPPSEPAPSNQNDPWAGVLSAPPEKPASNVGFARRVFHGFSTLPRDMVDQFMEGVHATLDPSGHITGEKGADDDLIRTMEKILVENGIAPDRAKATAAHQMENMDRNKTLGNLVMGPFQAVFGPFTMAPIRSFLSRPAEESFGLPKEVTETIALSAMGARAAYKMHRLTVRQDGTVKNEPIGDAPTGPDFKNAARRITDVIEGEFTVVDNGTPKPPTAQRGIIGPDGEYHVFDDEPPKGAPPQKLLPGPPKEEVVQSNLQRLWDEEGIHPAEAARDAPTDPFLRDQLNRPEPPARLEPIYAYHGSPHDFEAFDLSKIGTGEGAQSFGHGLYFAENEGVARSYAENLKDKRLMGGAPEGSTYRRQDGMWNVYSPDGEIINAFSSEKDAKAYTSKGGMYRVKINANREHMLDWDKPLGEQPAAVQKMVRENADTSAILPGDLRVMDALYKDPKFKGKWDEDRVWRHIRDTFPRMGEEAMQQIADRVQMHVQMGTVPETATGERIHMALVQRHGQERTAQILREAGIPGIKYLDQGSRLPFDPGAEVYSKGNGKWAVEEKYAKKYDLHQEFDTDTAAEVALVEAAGQKATSNFVIFDDKLIDITHKNGTEIIRQVDAGNGAPPRSANLSPDAIPRTLYPQAVATASGQAPAGGGQPPAVPPGGGMVPGGAPGGGSGLPPPPPQGPPLQTVPPARPPYFTYDDRNGFVKAFNSVISGWQKTFQPELVSDRALQADPRFAEYKSRAQNLKDQIVHNQEDDYQYWRGQSEADRIAYLRGFETGNVPPALRARADIHKQMMQEAHKMEVQAGSQADYFENYFPHLFQSPQQAAVWMKGKTAQVGPTWFQKERTFSTIREAMDAGLRLVSTNPEYLITHRLFSTADMLERMDLINDLKGMGLTETVEQARADRAARINIAQRMGFPIDVTTVGRDLSAEGWEIINAPDRKQWFIAPDIRPLWENAMAAKGLWGNEGAAGNTFRGWMSFKNAWVPIKLALSAFHPLHVAHINMTGHIVQAVKEASRGEYGDAFMSMVDVVYDPIAAAIPGVTTEGSFARAAWLIPEDARTPLQRAIVKTMEEGGLVANISEQLKIDSKRKLEEAWDKQQWFKMAPQIVRETLRLIGAPVFEHWIPNLKVAAYLREASDFLSKNPNIANDDIQRGVALRTIGKSVENRYGEMFYGNLFWNRTLKDAGIGSFISLGWNAGFIREFGGAAVGPLARGVRSTQRGPTQTEQTIYHAQSKFAYAFAYMAGAMLINGIITYSSTGQDPEGMDWAFPRTGRNNPDGTPHRITNMFYSRELPMVEKHIQSSGSIVGGVADTLYGKLVVGPLVELARNRDYYGNEIWSEGNPLYKKGAQAGQYLFGNQMMPMSVTGAQQAMKTGGGWDEAALAMIGFGPAPSYANKTATQNLIDHLFQKFVAPESRPQEMGVKAKERGDIRSEILMAQQRGDNGAVTDASQKWFKAGGSRQGLTNILMHIPPDVTMFRALPEVVQQQVMASAPPEEASKYKPYLKSDTASHVADLQIEAMTAMKTGDDAAAQRIAGQIQSVLSEAVHSGRITNIGEFQKSVQQNMMFRLQPQAAVEKADVPRQKKMMLQPALQ